MAKRARTKASRANRLADEKSPYLLQHADNPVDWYPWGDEAFEAARREDKPIFLSIGYSTCHWCHVMAHESFEDTEVAKMMNDTFVNIKVDREERPDIDGIYMTVCQMMTGTGGWPLTIVMTPDKRPFFAGTYFPKESAFGRAGLTQLVPQLAKVWREQRGEVIKSADQITGELTKQTSTGKGDEMDDRFINTAALQLNQRFDEDNGGFGSAPKFPSPHQLTFLLRFWRREADEWSLEMVNRTLKAMRKGGVYDQIGFGFHRYSTDARWLLPHFEKMLYDQAGLLMAYTEAYQTTGDPDFKQVAGEIVE
ncbi:MAG: thioredoxin domain-containing protein, partial [Candidatus Thermoplasmatota archaeon]|nr:thioredoxin domain-containing protein [Candidatus Thermoplasmatota archaeon]